jgi:hypothetical protein
MRISNINTTLAFSAVLVRFAPDHGKRAYRLEANGDVTLLVLDACDHCGCDCEGANAVTIVKPAKFILERLEARVANGFMVKTDVTDESGCNDAGDVVCPRCYEHSLEARLEDVAGA